MRTYATVAEMRSSRVKPCAKCPREAAEGSLCEKCRGHNRKANRKRTKRLVQEGKCACGRVRAIVTLNGETIKRSKCDRCLELNRTYIRNKRKERAA